jgi:hypothetical protein
VIMSHLIRRAAASVLGSRSASRPRPALARMNTMRHLISFLSSAAGAASVALFSFSAAAHIELIAPAPRYELPSNKSCPCGDGDSNRQCEQTAEESTDPNRSDNVTTFEAGATITVTAEEYIDHAGRMRVAFDPDGADLADFNDNILHDEADPRDATITQSDPLVWEFQVTLPTEPCENCTLQVIQVMNNNTTTPVLDPAPESTYYSCADIRIVPAGTLQNGSSEASSGGAGVGGSAIASGTGGPAPVSAGGASGAGSSSTVSDPDADSEDSGCALPPGRTSSSSMLALIALGGMFTALGLRRRRG